MLKLYIENRAFVDLQESSAIYKHHQIIDLAFKMNKLKTKYNALSQYKFDTLSESCPLFAIY